MLSQSKCRGGGTWEDLEVSKGLMGSPHRGGKKEREGFILPALSLWGHSSGLLALSLTFLVLAATSFLPAQAWE